MNAAVGSPAARFYAAAHHRENLIPLGLAFAFALVCYSSLYTGVVFTDHTIPNVAVNPYPSFKTNHEGRWFADLIILFGGGGGTQSFQAIAGFAIQALNGVLFAELLGVRGAFNRTLIALLVALHPVVLDYYAFTIDNISFTLGDTFILCGVLLLDRRRWGPLAPVIAIALFVLAMATYQPKLGVMAVAVIAWLATLSASPDVDLRMLRRSVAVAALCFVAALGFYWLTVLLTIDFAPAERTHINSPGEVLHAFIASYPSVATRMVLHLRGLPPFVGAILFLAICAGAVSLLVRASRRGLPAFFLCLVALAALPPAINLSYIANNQSWQASGRLVIGYAYAIPFLISAIMASRWMEWAARGFAAVTIYGFTIAAGQENGAMAMKSLYEVELTSRIVGRIEQVLPDEAVHPLVVVGWPRYDYGSRLVRKSSRAFRSQFAVEMFGPWRQVEIANFFLGRDLLKSPTDAEVASVVTGSVAQSAMLWPSSESVYMDGDVVVVLLERPGPHVQITWTTDRK